MVVGDFCLDRKILKTAVIVGQQKRKTKVKLNWGKPVNCVRHENWKTAAEFSCKNWKTEKPNQKPTVVAHLDNTYSISSIYSMQLYIESRQAIW